MHQIRNPAFSGKVFAAARFALQLVAAAALFAILAYAGIELTRGNGRIAALWLPNAMLAAILLSTRTKSSLAYLAACLAANVVVRRIVGDSWNDTIVLALANSVEVSVFALMIRRLCGPIPNVAELKTMGWMFIGCICAPIVSGSMVAVELSTRDEFLSFTSYASWMLAHGLGLMIVTPIVMILIEAVHAQRRMTWRDACEWAIFLSCTTLSTALIFSQSRFPFLFLASPVVIFAAFRTGVRGTAAAITAILLIASAATMLGSGPIMLVRGDIYEKLIALQLFLASCFAMGLPVAAALAERAATRQDLRDSLDFNQSILDNIQEIVFRTDAAGRWVFLNPAWESVTGYTVQESLGWASDKLLVEDDRQAALELYPKIAAGEITEAVLRQRFHTASGECRHIEVLVKYLSDKTGKFIGTTGNIRDVSDSVRHEMVLSESEARFRCLAEAAPVGIFRADALGQVTYVNKTWCEKIGLTVEEALGTGWMRALNDTTPYQDDPAFSGFNKPGDVRRRVVHFRAADGGSLWVETVNAAEFDENGAITGFVGVVNDITEQRQATERLLESERRFQALANLAPAGIFRTDFEGKCTYVNPAWLRITGLTDDQWQGDGWSDAVHPDDAKRVFDGWAAAVRDHREYRSEFRWVRPDGSFAWTDVSAAPEIADDGSAGGYIGVTMDVSERREAEEKLAARDEQLMLLANNATDAVFRLTLDGHCIYASPSARDLLGVDHAQLVGKQMLSRFHPDDTPDVLSVFKALAKGEIDHRIIAYRSEMLDGDGTYRWLEAHCGLVRGTDGSPREIIASIRDVSQTKALEDDLRHARERAEAAVAAKGAFLANMSHEIRTPMNGVLGFTELLAASDLDREQRRHVQLIIDSGRAMMRLLNDILDMSKIDAGQMNVVQEPVDLRHKLRNCARLMEPIAESKGVCLTVTIDPSLPRFVVGDPMRLRQILLNLIGNAVKFTDSGTIAVRAHEDAGLLRIEVIDSGVGIPPDQLDTIFDQFGQADRGIARKYGGTGLGLSISSSLAELMDGTIEVASELGKGSTFTLLLPLRAAAGADGDVPTEAIASDPTPVTTFACKQRVLVAEDHDINQELILAMCRSVGLDPTIAGDGLQAIELIRDAAASKTPFELVLMDIQMPVVDGLEATRRIRTLGFAPEILPIIALTANAYPEDVAACIEAGMQAHLAKPIRQRDLSDMIARFIAPSLADDTPAPADNMPPTPQSGSVAERYQERKRATLEAIAEAARRRQLDGATIESLASQLHKLAGTAGFFGDVQLGEAARHLENDLLAAEPVGWNGVLSEGWKNLKDAA